MTSLDSTLTQSLKTLQFRCIKSIDLELINHLMRAGKAYWGYTDKGLDRFMKIFGISDETYFDEAFGSIAESPQGTIGYYLFKTNEDLLELDYFFLSTQFIGQGYGRLLWDHCIQAAQTRGWTDFTFWSDPHALGFYEHMGAIKIDERPMVTLPGQMAPIMQFSVSGREKIKHPTEICAKR
jgi:GNAT superfamily N-acetyltransferase